MKQLIQRFKDWLFKEEDWVDDIIRNGMSYHGSKKEDDFVRWLKRNG